MSKRDSSGRFIKKEGEGLKIVLTLPTFSKILFWILLLVILSPWLVVLLRNQIWKEIISKFEHLFLVKEEEVRQSKRMAYFINLKKIMV